MAVTNSAPPSTSPHPSGGTSSTTPAKKGGAGAWVKKNKVAAAAIGGLGLVLLVAKKGSKGTAGESPEKAAELATLRAEAAAPRGIAGSGGAESGGSSGGSGSETPARSGEIAPLPGQSQVPSATAPAEADPNLTAAITAQTDALGHIGEDIQGLTAGNAAAAAEQSAGVIRKPVKKKAHGNPKKHPTKPKAHHGTAKSGITVHGRHFPGGKSVHKGPPRSDGHGGVNQNVTINFGGHSETHTSHNGGKSWTDHTRGANPPRRGVPRHSTPQPAHHTGAAVHHPAPRKAPAKRKKR